MQYRKFGSLDFEVSALGLGCMRFPVINGNWGQIDEEKAFSLIHRAIDAGVNYLDTAYPYHEKNSEIVVGKALKGGYREKVKLATKCPVWEVNETSDFDRLLDEQLQKLQVDYVDFYLLHALHKESWEKVHNLGALDFLNRAVEDGRIKQAGFSFHDKLDLFKNIIDSYDWDMCQIQLNYMDEDYQAGVEGLKYAANKGIAVVVMEPLRGGKLAKNVPPAVKQAFDKTGIKRTPAAWALRWVWNFPEVATVLSGMGTIDELEENIRTCEEALPDSLNEVEMTAIKNAQAIYGEMMKVKCTECGYCIPCPQEVKIPVIFKLYNDYAAFGAKGETTGFYKSLMKNNHDASQCIECGQCEQACPQSIEIIEKLKEAHEVLTAEAQSA